MGITEVIWNWATNMADFLSAFAKIIKDLFLFILELIQLIFMLILSIAPFAAVIIILCYVIWFLSRYAFKFFSDLDQTLSKSNAVEKKVYSQIAEADKVDYEKKKSQWQARIDQLTRAREFYRLEFEKLASQSKQENQLSQSGNKAEIIEPQQIRVEVPDEELTRALYKNHMKQQIQDILSSIEQLDNKQIYQEAVEKFAQEMFVLQVRYALPYKVILRLFEMYSHEELKTFQKSFAVMMRALSLPEYKRIYRNKSFSPEQKIYLLAQKGVLEDLDNEFLNFLYFLLNKYNYRQVKEIYQRFQKVWELKFYQGTITVFLPNEIEVSVFKEFWYRILPTCHTEYMIQTEIKKGVVIQSSQLSIDLSYQELIDRYIDTYGMEVTL